jgi:hypothetical protein
MRSIRASAAFCLLLAAGGIAAERHWQTGTCVDVGIKRTPWVGDPSVAGQPLNGQRTRTAMTEVATYVVETADLRITLEDIVPVGSGDSLDATVTVGSSVTFALDKNTAFVRRADGTEHRLRVTKKGPKPKR